MRYELKEIPITHEDDRRKLTAVFNGDFIAKQVKIIEALSHQVLGNHYHKYAELFYCLKGSAVFYLEDANTRESTTVRLLSGDRLIIEERMAHASVMDIGTIMVEATASEYVAGQCDVPFEVKI